MTNVFSDAQIQEIMKLIDTRTAHEQYIGARYVPIFGRKGESSIEWDGGTGTYEPLTIVLHQGNSFTSRQFVPVGIDILNQKYWANTGNYNAQVEQYRQEVLAFDNRITEADAKAMEADAKAMEADAKAMEADAKAMEALNDIAELGTSAKTNYDSMPTSESNNLVTSGGVYEAIADVTKAKTMVVIGDSFTDEAFAASPIWCDAIAPIIDVEVKNYAVSGCGFLAGSSTFSTQLDKAINEITDKETVTLIVTYGSINDLNLISGSNLYQAATNFLNKAKENFPKAKVIVASPTRYNGTIIVFKEMLRQLSFAVFNKGIGTFVNATSWLRNNAIYVDSTLHPTKEGQNVLADMFLAVITGGTINRNEYYANLSFTNATSEGSICFVQGNIGIINASVDHGTPYPVGSETQIGVAYNSCLNGEYNFPIYSNNKQVGYGRINGNYSPNTDTCQIFITPTEEISKLTFNLAYLC